jgi:hypothetical protein
MKYRPGLEPGSDNGHRLGGSYDRSTETRGRDLPDGVAFIARTGEPDIRE